MFVPSESVDAEIHDKFAMTCGPGDLVEIAGARPRY
jgi:ribosomal protein S17